jgi:hypothetical protein
MKKFFFLLVPSFILAVIIFLLLKTFILKNTAKGALQITATPKAKVYLDGTLLGETPLCKCESKDMLKVGEHTVRLVPADTKFSPYEEKVSIESAVLTVMDRRFGEAGLSEGSTISLKKIADAEKVHLTVLSYPETADVMVNDKDIGMTPTKMDNITEDDYSITVSKEGYKEKTVRVHTPKGYQLEAFVQLAPVDAIPVLTPTPVASVSPMLTVTPTEKKVTILETPNGFLRVRSEGSITAHEIGRVKTGESFTVLDEKNGWYQIQLPDGTKGWISSQFAEEE